MELLKLVCRVSIFLYLYPNYRIRNIRPRSFNGKSLSPLQFLEEG